MAKTVITATRSIDEIVADFATVTDTSHLRLMQSRLAYEFIGSTDGKQGTALKETFRVKANDALSRIHEAPLSVPAVTNLVNTWKYMLRANVNVTVSPEDSDEYRVLADVAKAAFGLASQSIAKKDDTYVNPAIAAILKGADAATEFRKAQSRLVAAKKEAAAGKPNDGTDTDDEISFDTVIAVLGMLTEDFFATLDENQQASIRQAFETASAVVA